MCACEFCAKAAVISPTQPRLSLKLLQTDTAQCDVATEGGRSEAHLVWGEKLWYICQYMLSKTGSYFQYVCFGCMRVGASQGPIVWQAEERQPTTNARVDSSPHLFSFSLGSLGHQDIRTWAINHHKQPTWTAVTFYSAKQEEINSRSIGHVCPQPKATHCCFYDNLQPPWLSANFLLMELSSLPARPEEVFINQLFSWALFRQAEPKRVRVIKTAW